MAALVIIQKMANAVIKKRKVANPRGLFVGATCIASYALYSSGEAASCRTAQFRTFLGWTLSMQPGLTAF